jgi:uncharacterized protein
MRGKPRWLALLAVAAIVAPAAAFTLRRAFTSASFVIDPLTTTVPADGFTTTKLEIHSPSGRNLPEIQVEVDDPHRAVVESVTVKGDSAVITVRAGVLPGEARFLVNAHGSEPISAAIRTTLDVSDSEADGTPDFLRLHEASDRAAFRRWFTLLAEAEYYRRHPTAEVNDCAALLRHSYREALRQHDSAWAKYAMLPAAATAGDIRQYQYPYTPLGAELFRVRAGSFAEGDLNTGAFAQFADAKTLWQHNSYFVGRDVTRARPGDLLFFRQEGHDLPFHAMIFLGPSQIDALHEPLVVYHTGPIGKAPGEIRRPTLSQLLNFPDPRWRPVPSNPSFLGVYRWNILRGAD